MDSNKFERSENFKWVLSFPENRVLENISLEGSVTE